MTLEFQVRLWPDSCEVDWSCGNRCRCTDQLCGDELLQQCARPGIHLEQEARDLEANFWILRAHRYTSPDVPGMTQDAIQRRTRGEGFPGVFPDDQRLFIRGPGWDFGTNEMEIEDYYGFNAME